MTPQNPQTPPRGSTAADSEGGTPGWLILVGLVMVVALAVGGYLAYDRITGGAGPSPEEFTAGDCIKEEESSSFARRGRGGGGSTAPVKVDCSSPEAQFAVYGIRPASNGVGGADRPVVCTDFDGATTEMATDGIENPYLCLGPVGADTSTSVNTITEGECMVVEGADARRADCSEPDAMEVLVLFRGDFDFTDEQLPGEYRECVDAGAYAATDVYSWGLDEQEYFDHEKGVCLAPAGDSA